MGKWIHCPKCDHRLFYDRGKGFDIEIKCPSCKRVMNIKWGGGQSDEKGCHDSCGYGACIYDK